MQKKTSGNVLFYDPKSVTAELKKMLEAISSEYPVTAKKNSGVKLEFSKGSEKNSCKINLKNGIAKIEYGQISLAARAIGNLLSGIVKDNSTITEKNPFDSFGIMLDCSRNAVMNVTHFKEWLRHLALMGYNMAMLYTEDTYEIDGEKFFGFMRGAYTHEELKEIDAYASALGIEMIPCIQTLGHLEQVLKWPVYQDVADTASVLLTNNEKSYELIEKMLSTWLKCFKTRRVHIGMDEAHDMGRGQYLKKFGLKRGFDIFNEHLDRLVKICGKLGVKPMIWSDMYFRMGSPSHGYYDKATVIPEDVVKKIPEEVQLVYWDYYHKEKEFYNEWIEKHRKMGFEPVMGSGIWTWVHFWQNQLVTEKNAGPCIESCKEKSVKELFFTMWGDDGAYCDFDSAMSGLLWCAEKAFGLKEKELEAKFKAVCKGSYKAKMTVSEIYSQTVIMNDIVQTMPRFMLWDDPLQNLNLLGLASVYRQAKNGILKPTELFEQYILHLNKTNAKLRPFLRDNNGGSISNISTFIKILEKRLCLSLKLFKAYSAKDKKALKKLSPEINAITELLSDFDKSFRTIWMKNNKPFGIESIQIRNAGIISRFNELKIRVNEFLNGEVKEIPELDKVIECIESMKGNKKSKPADFIVYPLHSRYKGTATASNIL